jgi:hypothetical protein
MNLVWGIILVFFTLVLSWLAQVVNILLPPAMAAKLGLNEPQSDVDPTFFVDTRGEALWDSLSIWPLPVAGILLLLNSPQWAYFGLVGGGMYLYFAGRGIVVRRLMQRRGIRIGSLGTLRAYYAFLILWGLIAVVTIVMAVAALPLP